MKTISPETFEKLKKIDSPTVANAIEKFGVREAARRVRR